MAKQETPEKPVELVVTFLGAVNDLNAGELVDQFKIVSCDQDYKLGQGQSIRHDKTNGLVILFKDFTGTDTDRYHLIRDVTERLEERSRTTTRENYKFMGDLRGEGNTYGKDGYAVVVTPAPKR
ncbi:MAG: hypothetical protein DI551_09085 [Micavibrio aeruginosavorus]|uniref:Uncharacterized protein n=1 Tax=Micavibrio aeruginosavorus TaxID=349221 RepID=A0A2W5Q0T0_9BACT|nr:MAG: hypothetical protein DI551_09085 [Micavibrio aeruginosavorus]